MAEDEGRRGEAKALIEAACTRGEMKRLGATLDHDEVLRREVWEEGRRRGVDLPDEALTWPGKRLLRRARARAAASQVRTTPTARDEAFTCSHCGAAVVPAQRTARDHCPRCLHSLHVDRVPGDRAAGCGGLLVPVDAQRRGDGFRIRYRCAVCGEERANKALLEVVDPDDWEALVALTAAAGDRSSR